MKQLLAHITVRQTGINASQPQALSHRHYPLPVDEKQHLVILTPVLLIISSLPGGYCGHSQARVSGPVIVKAAF